MDNNKRDDCITEPEEQYVYVIQDSIYVIGVGDSVYRNYDEHYTNEFAWDEVPHVGW